MVSSIAEIRSFIAHNDLSLAVRRILDASLDSGDTDLLKRSIRFSKLYNTKNYGDEFFAEANELIVQLENLPVDHNNYHQPLLNADLIGKTYSSGNFSLYPISLKIFTGDVLGVVGQNGNGKTTLLRCIAGQLAFDKGEINFNQLINPDLYGIKQHIAFIPQRIPRWYGLLKDNLHFSAAISGVKPEHNEVMVDFMLERLGLGQFAHLTWNQISSGYRTRFELARILLQKPRLLILDEPLANLDINAQQTILTDLRYMAKSSHNPMGVILSSQQLHEVEKVADNVLLIKDGSCVFQTGDNDRASSVAVLELETAASREEILHILGEENIQVNFNGGFYTLSSSVHDVQEMIRKLAGHNLPLNYFRDITHSTKRFI
jgi:ABC-2 type transport system ATP-binding protein